MAGGSKIMSAIVVRKIRKGIQNVERVNVGYCRNLVREPIANRCILLLYVRVVPPIDWRGGSVAHSMTLQSMRVRRQPESTGSQMFSSAIKHTYDLSNSVFIMAYGLGPAIQDIGH